MADDELELELVELTEHDWAIMIDPDDDYIACEIGHDHAATAKIVDTADEAGEVYCCEAHGPEAMAVYRERAAWTWSWADQDDPVL